MRNTFDKIFFFIFQHTPQKLIPTAVMEWMIQYITKRNEELKQDIVKTQWNKVMLERDLERLKNIKE